MALESEAVLVFARECDFLGHALGDVPHLSAAEGARQTVTLQGVEQRLAHPEREGGDVEDRQGQPVDDGQQGEQPEQADPE